MTTNQKKLIQAGLMTLAVMVVHPVLAQELPSAAVPNAPTDNLLLVMFRQVASNPASMLHGLILCIVAWLIDETSWINSRYIPHITILIGGATFWLYAGSATVAKCYPYPSVVLFSDGMISGLLAYGAHRQVIARILTYTRQQSGEPQNKTKDATT